MRKPVLRLLALALALGAPACGGNGSDADPVEATPYVIGLALDQSSYLAALDETVARGIRAGVDDFNGRGGAGGHRLRLMTRDMQADPARGALVVEELLAAGADMIVTTCDSDVSLPGALLAGAARRPVISTCGTETILPRRVPENFGFLNLPTAARQGEWIAERAWERGDRTAFLLSSPDEGYTRSLAAGFSRRFLELGGAISGAASYTTGDAEFAGAAASQTALDPPPDVAFGTVYGADTNAWLAALEQRGNRTPLLLADGNEIDGIFNAGPQLERAVLATYAVAGPLADAFRRSYARRYGEGPPPSFSALGYDLVAAVAAAVDRAGTRGPDVAAALHSLEGAPGATGRLRYEGNDGVPEKPFALVRADARRHRFVPAGASH